MPTPVNNFTSIASLRRYPDFNRAKSGSLSAALKTTRSFVSKDCMPAFRNSIFCPVIAIEEAGLNMLPLALAKHLSKLTGLPFDSRIVQVNSTCHTGASAMERLQRRPVFSGHVQPKASYVIVDDVVTTGSTVQALRLYLRDHGASVSAFVVLAGSYSVTTGSSLTVDQTAETAARINFKFGRRRLDSFLREYGIAESAQDLTNSQARYLLSFGDLDAIGDRLSGSELRRAA